MPTKKRTAAGPASAPARVVKESHPGKSFAIVEQTALKAADLTTKHWDQLKARLGTDPRPQLLEKAPALKGAITVQTSQKVQSKAATAAQNSELEHGYLRVSSFRDALTTQKAPRVLQKHYGVGTKITPNSVKSVRSAIKVVLDRHALKASADELAPYGVVEDDFVKLAQADESIATADAHQERARAGTPLGTRARNRLANELLDLIAKVAGAGVMQFATDAAARKDFQDLSAAGARGRKQLQKETGTTGAGEAASTSAPARAPA